VRISLPAETDVKKRKLNKALIIGLPGLEINYQPQALSR